MGQLRKLPIGIQTFEKLRKEGYLYVDKTKYVWDLVEQGAVYFLSRPRRFGKSLFISTLEAYFRGKRELFAGLQIEALENTRGERAWLEYPVVTFYLSGGQYNSEHGLEDALNTVLEDTAEQYDLTGQYAPKGITAPIRFKSLIRNLYRKTGRPVVVLVDEYDKPLLETMIINEAQEEANRQLYKEFFGVLKDEDKYLKFEFFTGVTKFSKVSIFSDLNHLTDISLSRDTSGICGITEEELYATFAPEIDAMAREQGMTESECRQKLARTYDGYHFAQGSTGVYNPYSILNAFREKDFANYWFETGTPTFVLKKLQQSDVTAEMLSDGVSCSDDDLRNYRAESRNPIPLMYQSGYLTIAGFDREFRIYSLKFPNIEVEYGFFSFLAPSVLGFKEDESPISMQSMVMDLRKGDADHFLKQLRSLFASVPYPGHKESAKTYEDYWRAQVFLVLKLMGLYVECEVHTSGGRADCVAQTARFTYVFEFKLDKSAKEALAQINGRDYSCRYEADEKRKVIKIGVNFDTKKRNIGEWVIE